MNSRILKGLFQLILVITFICMAFVFAKIMKTEYEPPARNEGAPRKLYVDTVDCESGPYQIVFQTTGTVVALAEVDIVPQVSGRVIEVAPAFYAGGRFEAYATLFQIDQRDYELEIQRLQAEVARTTTALKIEEAETEAALQEWSQMHADLPAPDLVARKPQIAEAKANFQAARAQLENGRLALSRTRFALPESGRVLSSRIANGQYIQAGQSYGTVFYTNALEIAASLEGKQLQWLLETPAAKITIETDYLGKALRYKGQLNRSIASIDTRTRFATVRFGFEEIPEELLPGVFVRVTIYGPQLRGITRVPISALQQDGTLWLVDVDNRLQAFKPEIVFREEAFIAIRNLETTATVVTNRLSGVTVGAFVTIR